MSNNQLKIVMCGCHAAGYHVIETMLESGVSLDYFVSLSPEQAESNNVSGYRNFEPLAKKYDIPLYYPEDYSLISGKDFSLFRKQKFDLLVQGGWQRLFPKEILNTLRIGAIGVHGSSDYLPKGRGRSPLNWSLIEGKKRFIMQLFLIKPGIDDGDVFDSEIFDINEFDDIKTLYMKNSIVSAKMLIRNLPGFESGTIKFEKQRGTPTYYAKRSPEDGRIDWEKMDVHEIYNFVRAQTRPYPGAFGNIGGEYLKIWHCQVFDTRITYPGVGYGECVEKFDNNLIINCRSGLLLIDDFERIEKNSEQE